MKSFLLNKLVDWSLLKEGFALPFESQLLLWNSGVPHLTIGEKRDIKIVIDGITFTAKLINNNFSRDKYGNHKEIVQIRYSLQSDIVQYFRMMFAKSFDSIAARKAEQAKRLRAPSDCPEYFCLYSTSLPDVFLGEIITANDVTEEIPSIKKYTELEWENTINAIDPTAHLRSINKTVKLRSLDRTVADGLKSLYKNCCQVCGVSFDLPYGSHLCHAHHIAPFTESLNNNPDNIMILCPNHHCIVHDVKPDFDREKATYKYPNGLVEPLKLNYHLGKLHTEYPSYQTLS